MAFSSVTILFSKNGDAGQSGWRQDITPGNTIACSLSSTIGVSTYRWRLTGRPEGSSAGGGGPEPIALGNTSWCSFTADVHGTYIVECLVNGGAPDATILTGGCAILESITAPGGLPLRLLGPNETDEDISDPTVNQGQDKMLNRWLRLIEAGGVGGGAVLSTDYNLGTSAADQTLTLSDANGGQLIIDGSGGGFTGNTLLQLLGPGPVTAFEVLTDGSMAVGGGIMIGQVGAGASSAGAGCIALGPNAAASGSNDIVLGNGSNTDGVGTDNILIASGGSITSLALFDGYNIGIGSPVDISYGDYNVGVGSGLSITGYRCTGLGPNVTITANDGIGIGDSATVGGIRSIGIGESVLIALYHNESIAMGMGAATTDANQMIVGSSDPGVGAPIHEFIVRGYNGSAIDTINVTDNPANDYQTGLSIPYRFSGGAVAGEPVYAQLVPPTGSLLLYIPGPPA